MKKILGVLLSLLLVICGCSCGNETFSVTKLENFANKDIKTYGIFYKKYENGVKLSEFNVISKCNNSYCEYYIKKEIYNSKQEYWYIYNETNYILKTKENGVAKADRQAPLTVSDKNFEVNINLLINYINNDIDFYKERNENFTYKVEDKKYVTEFKAYTLDEKLAEKSTNRYSFDKKNNVDRFVKEKENYNANNGNIISVEKIEMEMIYDGIVIPSF